MGRVQLSLTASFDTHGTRGEINELASRTEDTGSPGDVAEAMNGVAASWPEPLDWALGPGYHGSSHRRPTGGMHPRSDRE